MKPTRKMHSTTVTKQKRKCTYDMIALYINLDWNRSCCGFHRSVFIIGYSCAVMAKWKILDYDFKVYLLKLKEFISSN